MKQQRKTRFLLLLFSKKSSFFFPIFLLSVTLVTAKNQHRCWKARAARTRARVLPSLLTSLFTFAWVTAWQSCCFRVLLIVENSKIGNSEKRLSLFRDFFTLWGDISPYTYRGAPSNGASHDLFNLYGESHLIPTTDVLYDFSHLFFLFRRVPVAV